MGFQMKPNPQDTQYALYPVNRVINGNQHTVNFKENIGELIGWIGFCPTQNRFVYYNERLVGHSDLMIQKIQRRLSNLNAQRGLVTKAKQFANDVMEGK